MNIDLVKKQIQKYEGYSRCVYKCPAGKLTIGYGRNVQSLGVSLKEAEYLLENDIRRVVRVLEKKISYWDALDDTRQAVIVNMGFNLGISGLFKFRKMWTAIEKKDFKTAAEEMLDSRWAVQVNNRANRLAALMLSGDRKERDNATAERT